MVSKLLAMDAYTQLLLAALALLVTVFVGMILRQLTFYSFALLRATEKHPETGRAPARPSRASGWWLAAGGLGLLALAAGYILLGSYLPSSVFKSHGAGMAVLGAALTGLYALANGLGVALLRIEHAGVVALLWATVLGLGGWIGSIFW